MGAGGHECGAEQYGLDRFEAVNGLFHRVQEQARYQGVLVVAPDSRDAVGPQSGEADAVPVSVHGYPLQGAAIPGREPKGAVGGVVDDGGLGDGAVQEASAEGGFGLAPGVGAVVGVGLGLVFQAGGEPAAGRGELLVQAPHQESAQGEGRGDADGEAGEGEQGDESRGELGAQGAGGRASHGASGLRT